MEKVGVDQNRGVIGVSVLAYTDLQKTRRPIFSSAYPRPPAEFEHHCANNTTAKTRYQG